MAGDDASLDWKLPSEVSQEIVRRYADVLRVGRIILNGKEMCWDTRTSTEGQLANFCLVLWKSLSEAAPRLLQSEPAALRFAPYWICKAVSINYALIEVVLMVKQRVGVLCSVETREDHGPGLVSYNIDLRAGNVLCVSLVWRKVDNIVYCDPLTAKRQIKGTMPSLETRFRLPPVEGFTPAYSFQLRLKKSMTQKLTSSLTSTITCKMPERRTMTTEIFSIDEPLRSNFPLEASFAERPTAARKLPEVPRIIDSSCVLRGEAEEVQARPQWLDVGSGVSVGRILVGNLRVRIVKATELLQQDGRIWPDSHPTPAGDEETEVYATCSLAGRTKQTALRAMGAAPEWSEALHFPLRAQDLRDEVVVCVFVSHRCRGLRLWGRASVPVSSALGVGSPCGDMLLGSETEGEDRTGTCGGSERLAARLDGKGGLLQVQLDLVPEASTAGSAATVKETAACTAVGSRGAEAPERRSSGGSRTLHRGAEEEAEECVVEMGTPLGFPGLAVSGAPAQETSRRRSSCAEMQEDGCLVEMGLGASFGFPGLASISVQAERSEVKPQGWWCTRACTRDCA